MLSITDSELDILKLLWKYGRLSGREIHSRLSGKTGWAYTTTRTVIERMVKKKLASREIFHGLNLYKAETTRVAAFADKIANFADSVLDSDPAELVPLFVKHGTLSEQEIEELKQLLDSMEAEK